MSYISPIKIGYAAEPEEGWTDKIGKYMAGEVDNLVLQSCVKVGCRVDKYELEKALRYDRGQYEKGYADGKRDAAAAIEALEAERDEWIGRCYHSDEKVAELSEKVEKLKDEVKRLKEANDELREAQTYIDHYGDEWMTSAKDVPTSAYNHGYMDGKNEAEQAQLPKRGRWITIRLNNGGSYTGCSCCEAPIPTDTMLDYIPESESKYCYSCGAKMEVQDG